MKRNICVHCILYKNERQICEQLCILQYSTILSTEKYFLDLDILFVGILLTIKCYRFITVNCSKILMALHFVVT